MGYARMSQEERYRMTRNRLRIISALFVIGTLIIIARLSVLQIVHGDYYYERAGNQYVIQNPDVFDRGSIFFQKKDGTPVSAATVQSGFKVAIVPRVITDPEMVYEAMREVFPTLDYENFMRRATKENDPYEEILTRISQEEADALRAAELEGVQIIRDQWRFYPAERLAAQTLGFMAYRDADYVGRYGLERFYDEALNRSSDAVRVNFFAEIFGDIQKIFLPERDETSGDVYTTIEPSVQFALADALKDIHTRYDAQLTGGIVMNPQTGALYALDALPTFNSNEFNTERDARIFANPVVESVYEFGSVMKPLIVAMGLEEGVITAETEYFDSGSVVVGPHTIYNFDKRGRGMVTMQKVLDDSLNTGMVFIAEQLGNQTMRKYLKGVGFGEKTGIDLPGDVTGLVRNLESNRAIEFANISFGQGIALSPLALTRALATLGNGGTLPTPHVGSHMTSATGERTALTDRHESREVFSPSTSEEISRMLVHTFDSYRNGAVKFPHHSVAAKTGTAQIPNPNGGYYDDRNLHAFFGYVPAYNPQFIVFLYTVHPKGVRFASESLLDPFVEMTRFLIHYYDIPPDRL
jgi:cell division protein FtsI (penicillin-binding protein 3)